MIDVIIKQELKACYIEVKGHSGLENKGKDILCSSVSTLIIFSLNLIDNLKYSYNLSDLKLKDGYFKVKINLEDYILENIVETLVKSFVELSNIYPKNLKINK